MFLGLEALDDEGLQRFRKRATSDGGLQALEVARRLGIAVAVNIIADPQWDEPQFDAVRRWATSVPEIVHLTVATPYPGTETWLSQAQQLATRDYRLFDIQHAVLPTRLPLEQFYQELVQTQQVLNKKHLGWAGQCHAFFRTLRLLARGQTNFFRMLWKFHSVYDPARQFRDHHRPVRYHISVPDTSRPLPTTSRRTCISRKKGSELFLIRTVCSNVVCLPATNSSDPWYGYVVLFLPRSFKKRKGVAICRRRFGLPHCLSLFSGERCRAPSASGEKIVIPCKTGKWWGP